MILMSWIMLTSMLFMMTMSPIMIMIAILMFSSTMMTMKWIESNNPWIPLIFTLAFLGGMMIIFMYIISISNVKNKKNKNKQPILLVFVSLVMWNFKFGYSSNMVYMLNSSFFSQYVLLCLLIILILLISTKVINSPFKALKGAS